MSTDKATAKGPQPINLITFADFITRLHNAVDAYGEYCKAISAHDNHERLVDWLDHFQEFLDVEALEKQKNKP